MTPLPPIPPRQPDENALRLTVLRRFLDGGLRLREAVKETNEHFKQLAREANKEQAA